MKKNKKLNFDLNFLDVPGQSFDNDFEKVVDGDIEKSWNEILNSIKSIPTRSMLQRFAEPLIVDRTEILIAVKNQTFVDMIFSSDKIEHIEEACNKYFYPDHPKVSIIPQEAQNISEKPQEQNNTSVIFPDIQKDSTRQVDEKEPNEALSDKEETSFTKIRYSDEANINWKPIIIILAVIILCGFIGYGIDQDNKRTAEITRLKDEAYSCVLSRDKECFEEELRALKQYGLDGEAIVEEFKQRFNDERQQAISDLAYYYEHDKVKFESLKQQHLPVFFGDNIKLFNDTIEQRLGYKELSLSPVALPKSGVLHNYTGREAIAPLEIITQDGDDNYYIKLVDAFTNKTEIVIFLRGGETKEMKVPLGTYKIKRASGKTWYGEEYLFGHKTQYTASDEHLTFKISGSYVEGHTLTLYKVVNGNFSTKDISAEDF